MDAAWAKADRDHFFAASLEGTMWIVALNDFLRSEDEEYDQRRDSDSGGQIVRGLVWARNNGLHGLIDVHEVSGGLTFPMTFPMRFEHASWKARGRIVARGQSGDNESAYDDYVAGRVVQDSIREAQDFLWMRASPASPEGTRPTI